MKKFKIPCIAYYRGLCPVIFQDGTDTDIEMIQPWLCDAIVEADTEDGAMQDFLFGYSDVEMIKRQPAGRVFVREGQSEDAQDAGCDLIDLGIDETVKFDTLSDIPIEVLDNYDTYNI